MFTLVSPEAILPSLRVTSKKQALQELAARAAALTGIEAETILGVLIERERLGTTGIGNGVAIPHGRLPQLTAVQGLFARLEKPIDFDSVDDEPVDLLFLLLAPAGAGADHLKALAKVSRVLRNESLCQKLRGSNTVEAIYALLTQAENSEAA
jgi:PTS system nitrogen regulatory IIA component